MARDADKRVGGDAGGTRKRPYAKPKLQEYGSVAKLTQTGGSTSPEGGTPALMQGCL